MRRRGSAGRIRDRYIDPQEFLQQFQCQEMDRNDSNSILFKHQISYFPLWNATPFTRVDIFSEPLLRVLWLRRRRSESPRPKVLNTCLTERQAKEMTKSDLRCVPLLSMRQLKPSPHGEIPSFLSNSRDVSIYSPMPPSTTFTLMPPLKLLIRSMRTCSTPLTRVACSRMLWYAICSFCRYH